MFVLNKSTRKRSSRQQINIEGVRDGLLILPKQEYRLIASTSTINFELRSEAEQDAIIDTYQNFLNSLSYPIQILLRVREMNIDRYLSNFEANLGSTKSLNKQLILDYQNFIKELVSGSKVLTRSFYVVVPYKASEDDNFEIIQQQLQLQYDILSKGLNKLGIRVSKINSLEMLDLFYSFYNPVASNLQPISSQTLSLIEEAII